MSSSWSRQESKFSRHDSACACDDALMDRSLPEVTIDLWRSITVGD
jgi:hypothetical protein